MRSHRSRLAVPLPLLAITVLALQPAAAAAPEADGACGTFKPGPGRSLISVAFAVSGPKDSAYVATFEGGSSVWMRAMRKPDRSGS
jgi:hypothetical protein